MGYSTRFEGKFGDVAFAAGGGASGEGDFRGKEAKIMGASLGFKGYKPPDDTWRKMKAIYDSCHAAGMDAPDAVNDFFDWEEPTEHGVMVDLEKIPGVLTKYRADMLEGFDVNVTALPKDVTVIRFYISY